MIYKNLPQDLKDFIKTFIFGKCEYCNYEKYYWNLYFDITFYEYITIFSDMWDDYYICNKNPLKFKNICDYCYNIFHNTNYYTSNRMLQI